MFSVSLIIPTYNEAKNLPLLVEEILSVIDKTQIDIEFIFVDDNSPDGTGAVAEELSKKLPIKVIHRAGKLGLGSAVIAGFKASIRPYLAVMDADLSHDPAILNKLITSLSNADIAIGSRFEKGSVVEQWAWWRRLTSETGVFFARLLTGVKDPLSGYFCLKRGVIEENLDVTKPHPALPSAKERGRNPLRRNGGGRGRTRSPLTTTGYKILLEILVKGTYSKILEIPFQFRMRKYSTSKLNSKEYWLFLRQIIAYAWYKMRYAKSSK